MSFDPLVAKKFRRRIEKLLRTAVPYSYEECLCYALQLGIRSLEEGNYGIGAVIVFRAQGVEYVIGGRAQVFSRHDSRLHAERDALQKFEALARDSDVLDARLAVGDISPEDILLTRPAPDTATQAFLVTTLETCAACYQEILTHNTFGIKISEICNGTEHPNSGSGHHLRSENLPPLWRKMAEEQAISIFTFWHSELYELSSDIFNALPRLHRKHYQQNTQTVDTLISNVERLVQSDGSRTPGAQYEDKFLQTLSANINTLLDDATPYSYQEYFGYALQLGLHSLAENNFGVGSVLILRHQGVEYLIGGRNEVFTQRDSSLHADKNVIQKLEMLSQPAEQCKKLVAAGRISQQDILLKRAAPDSSTRLLLVTTLEACASCYETILTHNTFGLKISQICSGLEYSDSGSSHPVRHKKLPPTWKRLADEQNISRFTLWDPRIQHLCEQLFQFSKLEPIQRRYCTAHPPSLARIRHAIKALQDRASSSA